jgi:para-aminobenzoate synthetase component 2
MILLLDNYDSFTYNLVQYLGELGAEVRVFRNDGISLQEIAQLSPAKIVISAGPCTPDQAGISLELVSRFAGEIPLLGVCLGHQAIGQAFGGTIGRASCIVHGKTTDIHHDGRTLYQGLSNPFPAMRYHSLVVERETLPGCLEVAAETCDGTIMGLRHKEYDIEGVQFHPESILTSEGKKLLDNFLHKC